MADDQASADRATAATPAAPSPTEGLTVAGRKAIWEKLNERTPEFVPVDDSDPDETGSPDVGDDTEGADPGDETPDAATTAPDDDNLARIPERAMKAAQRVWSSETIRELYQADPDAFIRQANRYADADEEIHRRFSTLPPKKGGKDEQEAKPDEAPAPKYALPKLDELTKEYEDDLGLDTETARRRAQREIDRLRPLYDEANRAAERERESSEASEQEQARRFTESIEAGVERTFTAVDPDGAFYGKGDSAAVTGEHRQRRVKVATLTKLLVDGLRANGTDPTTPEAMQDIARLADQAVRFPHVQDTERQAVQKKVEHRSKQRSIPPGAAANGTRSVRKVKIGNHGDVLSEEDARALRQKYDQITGRS